MLAVRLASARLRFSHPWIIRHCQKTAMTGIRRHNYWVPGATFCRIRYSRLADRLPAAMACRTTPHLRGRMKLGSIALAWLAVAAINQQGGGVTESKGREGRHECLLIELAE